MAHEFTMDEAGRRIPKAVYDATCGVCSSIQSWADTRMRHPVQWVQVQEEDLECIVPNVDRDRLRKEFAFQESDGRVYYGGVAAAHLLSRLKYPWSLAGRLGLVPPFRQLSRPIYRMISRNRKPLAKGAGKLGHFPQPDRWPEE
ncbi:DUF393 domain-containing protein [bacterium]|nr:DUF393 domain-containing protein [bacterium]